MFYIRLKYKFLEQDLFIFCSHGQGSSDANLTAIILFFKRKKIPLEEKEIGIENYHIYSNLEHIGELHNEIKEWLSAQFKLLQNHANFQNINHVIFMADVNLGRPGYTIYPDFLLNNFVKEQFAPLAPNLVEIILFSSSSEVVNNAKTKCPESTKLLNARDLLAEVKSRLPSDLEKYASVQQEKPSNVKSNPSDLVKKEGNDKNIENEKEFKADKLLEVNVEKPDLKGQSSSSQQEELSKSRSSILKARTFSYEGRGYSLKDEAIVHPAKKQATYIKSRLFSPKEEEKKDPASDKQSSSCLR